MARRCPQCGASFPDAARFCDLDGTALVAGTGAPARPSGSRPRSLQSRKLGLIAAALVLLGVGLAAPGLVEHYVRLKLDVTLEEVRYPGPAGDESSGLLGHLRGIAENLMGEGKLAVRLRVRNDSSLSAAVVAASYTIEVSDKEVATGVWTPPGDLQQVPPGEDLHLDLVVRPEAASALDMSSELLRGSQPPVRVHGTLTLKVLWTTLTLPFEVRRLKVELKPGDGTPAPSPEPEREQTPSPAEGPEQKV